MLLFIRLVFVISHERLRQMFLRFKCPTRIGPRTLRSETRFSHVLYVDAAQCDERLHESPE